VGEDRGLALLEGHEVAGLVVGLAVVPAAPEDANPFEGQGAQDGLVGDAFGPAALVESLGPEAMGDGLAGPLDEGLSA